MSPTYLDNLALTFFAIAAFLGPLAILGLLVEGAIKLYARYARHRRRARALRRASSV